MRKKTGFGIPLNFKTANKFTWWLKKSVDVMLMRVFKYQKYHAQYRTQYVVVECIRHFQYTLRISKFWFLIGSSHTTPSVWMDSPTLIAPSDTIQWHTYLNLNIC